MDINDITYKINGAVFEVNRILGPGFLEKVYEKIQKIHEAQILNYLKASGYKVGLLINFKYPKAEIKRYIS